jgi:hypothetical protein
MYYGYGYNGTLTVSGAHNLVVGYNYVDLFLDFELTTDAPTTVIPHQDQELVADDLGDHYALDLQVKDDAVLSPLNLARIIWSVDSRLYLGSVTRLALHRFHRRPAGSALVGGDHPLGSGRRRTGGFPDRLREPPQYISADGRRPGRASRGRACGGVSEPGLFENGLQIHHLK